MTYEVCRNGTWASVMKGDQLVASVKVHENDEMLYVSDLQSSGDPGGLRAIFRFIRELALTKNVLLHVDATAPGALRLASLYARMADLEYLSFRVRPL